MYEYDFKKEKVNVELRNITAIINDVEYIVNILITNKNLLIFIDVNKNNILHSRGVQLTPAYILIFKISLVSLEYYIEDNNNTNIYTVDSDITIFNIDLDEYIMS